MFKMALIKSEATMSKPIGLHPVMQIGSHHTGHLRSTGEVVECKSHTKSAPDTFSPTSYILELNRSIYQHCINPPNASDFILVFLHMHLPLRK